MYLEELLFITCKLTLVTMVHVMVSCAVPNVKHGRGGSGFPLLFIGRVW